MLIRNGYSVLQILLHWLVAILILAAWWLSEGMGDALDARLEAGVTGIAGNTLHVWLGGAVFALVLIRIVVRFIQGAPAEAAGSAWAKTAATVGHWLLYLLMIVVPAMGAATWYLGIDAVGEPHTRAANALMIVAGGHALVAIWHQFVQKDGTLMRMLRPSA